MARPDQIVAQAPLRPWYLRHVGGALAVEVVAAAALLLALWGRTWSWVVAALLLVLVAALVIPMNGRSLWQRLALRVRRAGRRAHADVPADLPFDLVPLAQWAPRLSVSQTSSSRGGELGVATDGEAWTAVLALTSDDDLMADSWTQISLEGLEGLTRQDDVVFAGVQVLTYSVPCPTDVLLGADSPAAAAYREITEAAPPPTVRKTWLCVRLDPRLCLEAVGRRGDGAEGVHATLRFGVHRVQAALKRQGIETRALNGREVSEVLALCSGAGPEHTTERTREGWATWSCDGLVYTGCSVRSWGRSASVGYQAVLDAVASAPVLFAVTSFVLSPVHGATGAIRLACATEAEAPRALEGVRQAVAATVRLAPPGGTQVPTVLGTVPLGREVAA